MLELIQKLNNEGIPATTRAVAAKKKCNYSYAAKELRKLWEKGKIIKTPQGEWKIPAPEREEGWNYKNKGVYFLLTMRKHYDNDFEALQRFTEELQKADKEHLLGLKQAIELLLIGMEDAAKLPYVEDFFPDLSMMQAVTADQINNFWRKD